MVMSLTEWSWPELWWTKWGQKTHMQTVEGHPGVWGKPTFLPSAMMEQGHKTHTWTRVGIWEENRPRVQAERALLCWVIYDIFWEREWIEWFISRGQRLIRRGSSDEERAKVGGFIATQGHGDINLGLSCCPGPCLGSWPRHSHSLCWSPRLDNAKGRKCRAVQSFSLLLTVLTLGKIDPAPHQVNHSGERVLYFTWAAQ